MSNAEYVPIGSRIRYASSAGAKENRLLDFRELRERPSHLRQSAVGKAVARVHASSLSNWVKRRRNDSKAGT